MGAHAHPSFVLELEMAQDLGLQMPLSRGCILQHTLASGLAAGSGADTSQAKASASASAKSASAWQAM